MHSSTKFGHRPDDDGFTNVKIFHVEIGRDYALKNTPHRSSIETQARATAERDGKKWEIRLKRRYRNRTHMEECTQSYIADTISEDEYHERWARNYNRPSLRW